MSSAYQPELFDHDSLTRRLWALGLTGVSDVQLHRNRSTMVSVTPGGTLRLHRGYAYAPDRVLAAIVRFVRPGIRRRTRAALEREILDFPVHVFAPPLRPRRPVPPRPRNEDRAVIRRLHGSHRRLNDEHFDGVLTRIAIRVSRRMRRRLGEVSLDPSTNRPLAITMSYEHLTHDDWTEIEHTLLHEMIHQWQAETGRRIDHGPGFRRKAREVGIVPRAERRVVRRGRPSWDCR